MLTHFLDLLAAVISVTSLLIVTYGALIGIISFLKNEIRRFTGGYCITKLLQKSGIRKNEVIELIYRGFI